MRHERAFTVIELVITLIVAATLLALGVPAMQEMLRNNSLVGQTNMLVTDLQLARSEAIKGSVPVALCRSNDQVTCGGTSQNWTTGWLVFVDANASNSSTYQPTFNTGDGDRLLRVGNAANGGVAILSDTDADSSILYEADGTLRIGIASDAVFAICDNRGANFGRHIEINSMGRPRLIVGRPGTPIASCSP